jgi:hypothetical protein
MFGNGDATRMAMPSDTTSVRLVRSHLETGIEELERDASEGRYNTLCIRALGSAARVLGQHAVADRAVRLLRAVPDRAFWAGAITNVELPATVPERMRTVAPLVELEARHPPFRTAEIVERIRSCAATEKHFALCLDGRFQEARALAGSGVRLEEVGDTLAVLGEFDAARSVASDPALEAFRQQGVRFVLVIELFRRGRVDEAGALLAELESAGLGAWERVHLALGFADREPWGGYPFPDW